MKGSSINDYYFFKSSQFLLRVPTVITRPGGLKTSYATGQDNGFRVFYNGISTDKFTLR